MVFSTEREEKELADIDHDAIAHRLRQDVVSLSFIQPLRSVLYLHCAYVCLVLLQLEQAGKLQRKVAHLVSLLNDINK